jgi:hypothetical protein
MSQDGITLISEASDMENRHLQPLNDYGDRGFNVQFESKGGIVEIVTFIRNGVKLFTDDDGIASWEFVVTPESARQYPHHANMKAIVFND